MLNRERGIRILAAVLILANLATTSALAAPIEITPYYTNITSTSTTLTISSGTATCSGNIIGNIGTTKITATFYLQQKNTNGTFSTVKTFPSVTVNTRTLTFSDTYSVTSGKTYRLACDATVTLGGVNESVTAYSGERTA